VTVRTDGIKDRKAHIQRERVQASDKSSRPAVASLLIASGAAALVYQVLWVKQLSLVVGVDIYAITAGVSAFFAGLALGGAVFGRKADLIARPLVLYALLELGVAGLSVIATLALAHAALPFATLEARVGLLAWVLPFVLVGLPAFFMGGTLPVMVHARVFGGESVPRTGGSLYACNTAGAIAGAILAPFLLIPSLGVRGTAFAAAAANIAAAFGALALDRRTSTQVTANRSAQLEPVPHRARIALVVYAIAGGIALGYEVVWSQAIVQFTSTRSFAFAIVLGTYLAGLVAGSAAYARFADRIVDPWGTFGLFIGLAGLIALAEIAGLGNWFMSLQSDVEEALRAATGSELAAMCGRFLLAALGIVFLPTTLLGAAFPAALRLASGAAHAGRDMGMTLAFNTLGGIAGTLLTGFLFVPAFGLVHTLGILAVAAAALAGVAAIRGSRQGRGLRFATLAIAVLSMGCAIAIPKDKLVNLLTATRSGGRVIFYEESRGSTVCCR
jgi:spermidine synthase